MSDYDLPMESSPPPEQAAYPDIDETLHYPWQSNQHANADGAFAAVIDPRLYQGLHPQDEAEDPEEREAEEAEGAEDFEAYPPDLYGEGDAEDSDFVYAEDESER